jgi:beta-1,4-mannosyltransferase
MLSLGWLRPYKNVPRLIKEFKALAGANKVLIVAGRPSTADLRREIELEAREDPRIRLDLAYLSEEKVATYLQAADLVVLPYKEILNSGTALLSLSLNRPLLVPKLGALHELAAEVGVEWVRLYEGELTTGELDRAVQWAQRTVRPPAAPLENRAWPLIASHTLEVYKEVIGSLPAKHPAAQSSKAGAAGSLFNECGATRYHGSVNPQSDACGGRTNAK